MISKKINHDNGDITVGEMAATEFEAWGEISEPSAEQMANIRTIVRVAMGVMRQTKPELVAVARDVGEESIFESIGQIEDAASFVSACLDVLEGAAARLTIALTAAALDGEAGKGGAS